MHRLALIVTCSLATTNAHADCAVSGLTAKPLTAANTALPADGGVVIAALQDHTGTLDPGDIALQHTFSLDGGGKLATRSVAPGLAVVAVGRAGKLVDNNGIDVLAFAKATAKLPPLPAPKVAVVELDSRRSRHGGVHVYAALEDLPAGALAVILADARGKPRSFGVVGADPKRVMVYGTNDCQALPNGTLPTKAGDKVTVKFVDATGRISAATAPITVRTVAP